MKDLCACGHVRDEHIDAFLCACTIEECECIDFEEAAEVEEL